MVKKPLYKLLLRSHAYIFWAGPAEPCGIKAQVLFRGFLPPPLLHLAKIVVKSVLSNDLQCVPPKILQPSAGPVGVAKTQVSIVIFPPYHEGCAALQVLT